MNNKIFLLLLLSLVLIVPIASAVLTDAEVYYSFDNANVSGVTVYDVSGATVHDGKKKDIAQPAQIAGLLNEAVDVDYEED